MVGRLLPTLALFLAFIAGLLHGVAATAGDTSPSPAPPPPLLRLHLVADDMNATSHTQNLVWRDRSSFGNDLTPHLAAPEVIEDAFNGHKALRFGFSDLFQDGVEGFSCMRLDPAASRRARTEDDHTRGSHTIHGIRRTGLGSRG